MRLNGEILVDAAGEYATLYVTASGEEEARALARALLEARLAACANLFPIGSMYWWEGRIEEAREWAVLFKTRAALVERAVAAVKAHHSYDVPCAVAFGWRDAHAPYAQWVEKETTR